MTKDGIPQDERRPDVLGRDVALPHAIELPVLGLRVRFETNDPAVLAVVEDSFGVAPRGPAPPGRDADLAARVRLFVEPGDEGTSQRARFRFRSPAPNRLLVATSASIGVAEIDRHESYAFVSDSLLAAGKHFQYGMLETLTLILVSGANRRPVHAALLAAQGVGLLLVGRSGSGKSSLTYAAQRNGICVLAEDAVYAQLQPQFQIWAAPDPLVAGRGAVLPRARRTAGLAAVQWKNQNRGGNGSGPRADDDARPRGGRLPVGEKSGRAVDPGGKPAGSRRRAERTPRAGV
jgi:hypothetical protein